MKPAEEAKQLGARALVDVAEFYQISTKTLQRIHKRNLAGFRGMVKGYLEETQSAPLDKVTT